ncbi:MAG: hypothetical protein ACXU82_18010 [Caulobacteraceae bacterium]
MTALDDDIAAFEEMKADLEAQHLGEWVIFHHGRYVEAFADFQSAATAAVDRFDLGPYLIRQVGTSAIQLSATSVFRPAHAIGPGGV